MKQYHILWADDEIDLLKPHILFLQDKGYKVTPVNNGTDAIELLDADLVDIVFLDENMPGLSGLETLQQVKAKKPNTPVIMITKSEEENIMEDAIGRKISDYLIKPINPNQILLTLKRTLDKQRLITDATNSSYRQDFQSLAMAYTDYIDHKQWVEIYKKLIFWELEIDNTLNRSMKDVVEMQKAEANNNFAKFIIENYEDWMQNPKADKPILSNRMMTDIVFPFFEQDSKSPLFFFLIDNLRYDQWRMLQPIVEGLFTKADERATYSILPTTTAYARNAIFSGLMPIDIAKKHPELWVGDDEEEGKNNNEEALFKNQLKRLNKNYKFSYHKILNTQQGKEVFDRAKNLMNNDINLLVYNFVDMLSHARTDMQVLRELASDEAAYRSLTLSWFKHSPLYDMLKRVADLGGRVVLTTDHGTVRVKKPVRIVGDKNVNTNLRYKQGKNLSFDDKNIFVCRTPEKFNLPKLNVSTTYVFTIEDYFFAYPNNYNYYVAHFKDTFQHGGVSMEEMITPIILLNN